MTIKVEDAQFLRKVVADAGVVGAELAALQNQIDIVLATPEGKIVDVTLLVQSIKDVKRRFAEFEATLKKVESVKV